MSARSSPSGPSDRKVSESIESREGQRPHIRGQDHFAYPAKPAHAFRIIVEQEHSAVMHIDFRKALCETSLAAGSGERMTLFDIDEAEEIRDFRAKELKGAAENMNVGNSPWSQSNRFVSAARLAGTDTAPGPTQRRPVDHIANPGSERGLRGFRQAAEA